MVGNHKFSNPACNRHPRMVCRDRIGISPRFLASKYSYPATMWRWIYDV